MGTTALHLMVEAPKWASLNSACTPGSTVQFYSEGRLNMLTDDWSGTGKVAPALLLTLLTLSCPHCVTAVALHSSYATLVLGTLQNCQPLPPDMRALFVRARLPP